MMVCAEVMTRFPCLREQAAMTSHTPSIVRAQPDAGAVG